VTLILFGGVLMFLEGKPGQPESETPSGGLAPLDPGAAAGKEGGAPPKSADPGLGSLGRGGFFDTSQNVGVFATDTLPAERRDFLLDYAAEKITKFGMAVPAVMALEVTRPLSFIGSQFVWGAGPLAAVFINDRYINEIALLLEDRSNIEALITRIEDIEAVKQAEETLARQEAKRQRAAERAAAEARGEKPKRRWWPFGGV